MNQKRIRQSIIISFKILVALLLFFPVFRVVSLISFQKGAANTHTLSFTIDIISGKTRQLKLYYKNKEDFSSEKSVSRMVLGKEHYQELGFTAHHIQGLSGLRLDIGKGNDTIFIRSFVMKNGIINIQMDAKKLRDSFEQFHNCETGLLGNVYWIRANGEDPFLVMDEKNAFVFDQLLNKGRQPWMAFIFAGICSIFLFLSFYFYQPLQIEPPIQNEPVKKDAASFEKISSWFLIGAFSILLIGALILKSLNWPKENDAVEKRQKEPWPEVGFSTISGFPDNFAAYFNDHFWARSYWIKGYSFLKSEIFKISNLPDKVMKGKDGWLFLAEPPTQEYYRNANLFTWQELDQIKNTLEERSRWCRLHGSRYYLFVPPMSSTIYPEYLPDFVKKDSSVSCLDQVIAYLKNTKADVNVVDVRKELTNEKKEREVYYKTDFHWNVRGAFIAYRKLAQTINQDTLLFKIPAEKDYNTTIFTSYDADLACMLNLPQLYPRNVIVMKPVYPAKAKKIKTKVYPGQEFFLQDPVNYQNDSAGLPSLVMFRDSYAVYLIPFIAEHFHKSDYIWTSHFIPEIIQIEKPQIVIQEIIENAIKLLLLDNPKEMKEEIKLAGGPVRAQ